MPNWVYNSVSITGETGEIESLVERLGKPYTIEGREVSQPFSFWNIVAPTNLEAYFEVIGTGGRTAFDEEGWYGWNCRNWGCKWDANCNGEEVVIDHNANQTTTAQYHFDTPWSHPEPIIDWLVKYSVEQGFSLEWHYEEEQGWGGEICVEADGTILSRGWDIPDSHEDNESLSRECVCSYESETEYWYDDCPRPTETPKEVL